MYSKLEFEGGSMHPTYVIAIAGTPPESRFEEDFAVGSVVNFGAWVASGFPNPLTIISVLDVVQGEAHIPRGTAIGLHALLTVPAPEGAVSAGTTLLEFVTNLDNSTSPRVITTGHSLGGALSPSLVLALVTAGAIPVDIALTYPSAGASLGDTGFTNLFIETFPAQPAWQLQKLEHKPGQHAQHGPSSVVHPEKLLSPLHNIPTLYGLPVVPLVGRLTFMFIIHTRRARVPYMPIPSQYFTGPEPATVPSTLGEFMQTAARALRMRRISLTDT